jgi:hypothetical protein
VVLFLASLAMNTAIAAILFVVLGGTKLSRTRQRLPVASGGATTDGDPAASPADQLADRADLPAGQTDLHADRVDLPASRFADRVDLPAGQVNLPADRIADRADRADRVDLPVGQAAGRAGRADLAADPAAEPTTGGPIGEQLEHPQNPEHVRLDLPKAATLFGLVALVVSTLVFDLDAGLTAITVAVVLSVLWPASSRRAVGEITWPTVLLICGVLTYVAVLQEIGTIDYVGNAVSDVGVPLLAALLLCYIGGIVSAFASSVGLMGALIPLAVPFLAQGTIGAVGMIAALAVSATMVDVSPFSTNGALVLANAKDVDRDRFFKQLMVYGAIVVAVAPLVAWLAFVVPGWG